MSYLLYAILPVPLREDPGPALRGWREEKIFLVREGGLVAAVSAAPGWDCAGSHPAPPIPELLAYGRVIEAFWQDPAVGGIIPLRYGCFVREEGDIRGILRERRETFKALLVELKGCQEFGLRILAPEAWTAAEGGRPSEPGPPVASGRAYLEARRISFLRREGAARGDQLLLEHCRSAFSGLFRKWKEGPPGAPPLWWGDRRFRLLSAYLLVPRSLADPFRVAFRQVRAKEPARLLLSGPWPPYNFASDGTPAGRNGCG